MKKTFGLIAICLAIATSTFPAFAQQPAATPQQPAAKPQQPAATPQQPAATPQDPQCTPENKLAWYTEFRKLIKTDQPKAYELAKKWLACPEVAGEETITAYLKDKFIAPYEKALRKDQVNDLVYNKKDYPKAFELGKAVLTDEPENLNVLIDLAYAGYAAAAATAKNESFSADAMGYAKKALQLIESGKTPPYGSKDEALASLSNIMGQLLMLQKNPSEALSYLLKVGQYESKLKKLPFTYASIAAAYNDGLYAKLAADYEKHKGKDETPESKLALENINQVIDRMIDAYARAVALAGTDAANQEAKKVWMETLNTWYKFRHNQTDAGLTEVIASVLSKPLPPEPTPITTLPTPPASTPATGSTSSPGSTTPATTVATDPVTANKPAATSTTTTPTTAPGPTGNAAQPAKTTTPVTTPVTTPKPAASPKPKPKRNHRRA